MVSTLPLAAVKWATPALSPLPPRRPSSNSTRIPVTCSKQVEPPWATLPVSGQAAVTHKSCTSILLARITSSISLASSSPRGVRCNVLRTPITRFRLLRSALQIATSVSGLLRLLIKPVAVSRSITPLLEDMCGTMKVQGRLRCANAL